MHLFGFDAMVYGDMLSVALIDFIRPEQKFDSTGALKASWVQKTPKAPS